MSKLIDSPTNLLTLNDLLQLPEEYHHLPLCIHTGWEGSENIGVSSVTICEGEYINENHQTINGKYLLLT